MMSAFVKVDANQDKFRKLIASDQLRKNHPQLILARNAGGNGIVEGAFAFTHVTFLQPQRIVFTENSKFHLERVEGSMKWSKITRINGDSDE